jgi:hypothetical protein
VRKNDHIPLVLWSWLFEVVLPRTELFGRYCVADPADVFYYAVGALGAAVFWRWWYGNGEGPAPDGNSDAP